MARSGGCGKRPSASSARRPSSGRGRRRPERHFGAGVQNGTPQAGNGPSLVIVGSIVAGNTDNRSRLDADFSPDCYSPAGSSFTSEGSNLIGIVSANCGFAPSLDLTGTGEAPLDPLLAALAANGGLTRSNALDPGSPAIDALSFGDCPATDQRGTARPRDGDANAIVECDIGAVER